MYAVECKERTEFCHPHPSQRIIGCKDKVTSVHITDPQNGILHLWVARGRKPTQPKKSPRKPFSCIPTKPVAGEALKLHL